MRKTPLVSVIIPAFNAQEFIARALASVQAQSFPDWEALVIDDGSRDGTCETVAGFAQQDARIKLLRHETNTGAAAARNTGIAAAQGRYIAFLDSDDMWLPEKLTLQLGLARKAGAALVYGPFWRASGSRKHLVKSPASLTRAGLLRGNAIGCLTAMYDRDMLGKRYFPDIPLRQDWALWLNILADTDRAYGTDAPLATYHMRSGSLSSNKIKALAGNWRMYRDIEGLGRARATWLLGESSLRRILRG